MYAKETTEIVGGIKDADIKQELLDTEPPDSSTDTMDKTITNIGEENLQMMGVPSTFDMKLFNTVEDNKPLPIKSVIKQEPKSLPDLELIKRQVQSWRVVLQRLPTYTHTGIKQEPMDVDQTDPDDVTTPLIPEGSEQLEVEDVKYVNTRDYLDIGETVICEQDRAISEQDRARPGTSPNDNNIGAERRKNKSGEKSYKHEISDKRLIWFIKLKRHMRRHIIDKPYKCEACDYRCTKSSILKIHMGKHTVEKPYKCKDCDYRCTKSNDFERHVRKHTGEKPYKCEICDYRCSRSGILKIHMRTHTGVRPYQCDACVYRSTTRSNLRRHGKTHTEESGTNYNEHLQLPICTKIDYFKAHLEKHTGEKPYKCETCDYRCSQSIILEVHMRTHTGENPYKCKDCDYRCTKSNDLERHVRKHTGEKPYKCEICDYRCSRSGILKIHMRTHTGVKPYQCDACDYRSTTRSNLRRHGKTHTEESGTNYNEHLQLPVNISS